VSTTVRITDETHERLVTLAGATGRRMHAIVEDAVVAYQANAFWDSFDAGYNRLADNAEQWSEIKAERAGEALTLADDLDGT
jgi:predicted transcriptional regulator